MHTVRLWGPWGIFTYNCLFPPASTLMILDWSQLNAAVTYFQGRWRGSPWALVWGPLGGYHYQAHATCFHWGHGWHTLWWYWQLLRCLHGDQELATTWAGPRLASETPKLWQKLRAGSKVGIPCPSAILVHCFLLCLYLVSFPQHILNGHLNCLWVVTSIGTTATE